MIVLLNTKLQTVNCGMKLPRHWSPFLRPPLHPSSSSKCLSIAYALKLTKFRRRSKSDLTTITSAITNVHDVKYLPSFFDGSVLFVLALVSMGVLSAYVRFMDNRNKMCDGHLWYTTKTTTIQNDFGFFFLILFLERSSRAIHVQCMKKYHDYVYQNGGVFNYTEWIGLTLLPCFVGYVAKKKSTLKCKICGSTPMCIVLCHALKI